MIRLGIPSKGRLMGQTFHRFSEQEIKWAHPFKLSLYNIF